MITVTDFVDPEGFVDPEENAISDKAKLAAGLGVGGAGGAWAAGRLARWAFPGLLGRKFKAMGLLNKALISDTGEGLKTMYPRYTAMVRDSGKPVTFYDWMKSEGTRTPETDKVLNQFIDRGGPPDVLAKQMEARGEGQKGRVLSDLAKAMGIPEMSAKQTAEEFAASKASNAKTLYDEAFRNKQPLMDQKIYDLFQKHGPVMEGALENAREAFKYDPSKQIDSQTVKALAGHRADEWKWPLDAENVPPVLHIGEPKNQLQTVITPNIESLDRMKRALWNLQQKRVKEGAGDVGEIAKARRELTSVLDEIGPSEYQAARKQYAGDVALEEAADMGGNLFKQNPDDFRMDYLRMSPDERTALARGFYGHLLNMNDPKFIREVVSGSPNYAKQRDILSAIFPDTTQMQNFLSKLEGEKAILAGNKAGLKPGSAESSFRSTPHVGISAGMIPHGYLFNALPMPPYDPGNLVPKAGAKMIFGEPKFSPGATIQAGEHIPQFNRGWPYGGSGGSGGLGWEVGAPAIGGGLGAASPYLNPFEE